VRHVSYCFRSCLPPGKGSRAPYVPWLQILPPNQEGSDAATACPSVSCGPQASSIKKSLAGLSVQLGSHAPNARAHVSNTPDARTITDLQDVRASGTFNACKTCRQAADLMSVRRADMWLQYHTGPVDQLRGTAISPGDLTGQCRTVDRAQQGRTTRQDVLLAAEDIIYYS
jgi:hypothetical protein